MDQSTGKDNIDSLIAEFSDLLKKGARFVAGSKEEDLKHRASLKSWSKMEILGHLIDSGIYNLQRFSEIQFESKPYKIKSYNQDELVKINDYQNADPLELLSFWLSVNERIVQLLKMQNKTTLNYQVELETKEISDLRFLIQDYIAHLDHHLTQITHQKES